VGSTAALERGGEVKYMFSAGVRIVKQAAYSPDYLKYLAYFRMVFFFIYLIHSIHCPY
jgi:hypothetical protein